jgi:hypothetical protein
VPNPCDHAQTATALVPIQAKSPTNTSALDTRVRRDASTQPPTETLHKRANAEEDKGGGDARHKGANLPIGADFSIATEPRMPGSVSRPAAEVVTINRDHVVEHELVLTTQAASIDITEAMVVIPPSAVLVGYRVDKGIRLIFREVREPV